MARNDSRPKRRTKISGQFTWRLREMLELPAYRLLSLSAHRVMSRLEIEISAHAGTENGRLPVTHKQFAEYGIDPHSIAPAIRELVALGFVEVTEEGRAGNAEWRAPNLFRITWRPTDTANATDEWKRITTFDEAARRVRQARAPRKNPSGENAPFQWGKPTAKTEKSQWGKPSLQVQ